MDKFFIGVTVKVNRAGRETEAQVSLGKLNISSMVALKGGGTRVVMNDGTTYSVMQAYEDLIACMGADVLAHEPSEPENSEPAPADEAAEVLDPADIAAIASANAVKLAEASGIDIADVTPNAAGRIGKPEVERHLEGLKALAEAEAEEDAPQED